MSKNISRANFIFIRGLRLKMRVGIYAHEKKPQILIINSDIELDSSIVWDKDKISETLDYDVLVKNIERASQQKHYNLIESFLETIAAEILSFKIVQSVKISAAKPKIFKNAEYVGVEIIRTKY